MSAGSALKKEQISFRLSKGRKRQIEDLAAHRGVAKSALLDQVINEAYRQDRHPGIVFVDGASGRRPALAGTGLDVWEIVTTVEDNAGSISDAAHYLNISVGHIQRAMTYYNSYKAEIDNWVAENDREFEQLKNEAHGIAT